MSNVVGGGEKRNLDVGRVHLHRGRHTHEDMPKGIFGAIIRIWKVFWRWKDNSCLKKPVGAKESR